jgi:hypothetical protein
MHSAPTLDPQIVINTNTANIANALAPYEPVSATLAWFDTLRAIEDCINLVTIDWEGGFDDQLFGLPLPPLVQNPLPLLALRPRLVAKFSETFANRFQNLMVQGAAMGAALAQHGLFELTQGFLTVGTMIGYLQSRRRHFIALLYTLPSACRGRQRVHPLDTLSIFVPLIDMQALQIVGAQQALLIEAARARLGLPEAPDRELAMLDGFYLEPERVRITEMPITEASLAILATREPQPTDRLFSAAELRNDIIAIEAAYDEFDLVATEFGPAAAFVRQISREHVERDFWVAIRPKELDRLFNVLNLSERLRKALVQPPADYAVNLDSYAPFILIDGTYRSTVTLLSRFIYHWRSRCLDRSKRYQIRTGFIFEKAVADALERQGFAVQKVTRINRHEFDVVTLRDGIVWNVQCKNNMTDLVWVEAQPRRFARYNRNLAIAYERALTKELDREGVLMAHLGKAAVEHMLVSRFPVVTDNPRIVAFSRIDGFAARADAILATRRRR